MEVTNGLEAGRAVAVDSLATRALDPKHTDDLFLQHRGLFVELCARWIVDGSDSARKIAAFGRITPLAPYLAEHVERFFAIERPYSDAFFLDPSRCSSEDIEAHLLGVFRLLSFDCRSLSTWVRPRSLQYLFHHESRVVRYLALRTFCLYVHAADHAAQETIKRHVGTGEIIGSWEGETIDYRFLSLWEEKRWSRMQQELGGKKQETPTFDLSIPNPHLSAFSVNVNGILLPRLDGAPSEEKPNKLISTPTTESNLRSFAAGLLGSSPLLLTGLAGSGKTLLVRHFAWQLNKLDTMVTLHLNEQSDAKLLVGMYATGTKPGTFSWRPGVLTTAVKEGRWIFIEDLDRAPNEVISTLLPLIERGELMIPSRGETIRASRGFRIIATMRSSLNPRGEEIKPRQNLIGHRFWKSISIHMPALAEFETVVSNMYPKLKGHVAGVMRVYTRLLELFSDARFSSENGTSLRALTPRDLLKWCDRIALLLTQSSSFNTAQTDDIFMEALDCFAGSLRSDQARSKVMACVAEELHIDPQRREHLLTNREVKLEIPSKNTTSGTIRIGRSRLSRHKTLRKQTSSRPFSTNDYTLRLLEKVAVAVDRREPLLLVGETGTGKTTTIQYLAEQLGRKLVAFNLSQQSESGEFLGGYKPVNVRSLVIPLKDEFDDLFDTTFSRKKNQRFLDMMGKRVAKGEWRRVCILWREALKMVDAARKSHESQTSSLDPEGGQPKKKRKVDSLPSTFPKARWEKFAIDLHDLEAQLASGSETFAFSFLEGNIVKAVRNGDWVLLDEINLASSDTLEALTDLLGGGPDGTPSILLTETGSVERVVAHPNFRVFAAMNPATDVGKKDLPPGIRSRFTELYVESPDNDVKSLRNIVEKYLGGESGDPAIVKLALDVTTLYLDVQKLAKSNMLVDGADQKAHFSLRTLTRTLSYAREIAPLCTLRRALYEGFHMSFLTFLGKASEDLVAPLIKQHLFSQRASVKAELGKPLQQPGDGRNYVRQGHYWLRQGSHAVEEQPHYIITPFVQRNMNNLIRAASTRRYPVLIQGPTSSGKTSMIEYLAKRSGNKFVRINNHEHTDLQEYLGSYISGTDGKLSFQEGILVRALREGHWIVLDELNLAPTDVLEALNRLLDDNRELLIPETQEIVRPHDDFMLFATQNPAGLYGGRKVLSRAFRNRFLELHFDDIPVEELTEILHRRTMIPESWCKRIVKVYQELSILRQENRLFEQKSFATLRDLFRWAQRKADTIQDLANNGYMLLAERVRKEEERRAVKKVIETVMSKSGPRVQVDEDSMYSQETSPEIKLYEETPSDGNNVVWTRAMRRLFVLVAHALRNNEPVLLVGETGCGKTTVCQMLAETFKKQLHIVNAHQNTETGDLIGAQRPIRNRTAVEDLLRRQLLSVLGNVSSDQSLMDADVTRLLDIYDKLDKTVRETIPVEHHLEIQANRVKVGALFEWADGSLVHAMKTGQFFLLDEISLADDSVLERLNSVLEPSRTLLLAEKGPIDSFITAIEGFQFLATMNPGGDYGKRELSPALRNRFTEIWVPSLSDVEDVLQIVRSKLQPHVSQYAGSLVSFAQWFNERYNTSVASSISIRDTLAWVSFINQALTDDPGFGVVHGAAMVFIDTLGANPAGLLAISSTSIDEERRACLHRLTKLLGTDVSPFYFNDVDIRSDHKSLQFGIFSIPKLSQGNEDVNYAFEAPTTRSNAMRVVRALQLPKPILLEGNPGVGKTTLVTAIARVVGKPLTRLNLSEQTDLMDLFGSDVPIEGGQVGTFAWRDAPFLKAMKRGDWVLLDEMNLASQSVLEGLNAVLDHRGEVYISELDQTFHKHPDFRVFAAQNPHHQGGGRKGLPASFVNRFTVVYADVFRMDDLLLICSKVFPSIGADEARKLISFVASLDEQVVTRRSFGSLGSPWEFNLRDTLRWLQLLGGAGSARDFLDTIFVQRFRTEGDRERLLALFEHTYGAHEPRMSLYHDLGPEAFQVGLASLRRDTQLTRPEQVFPLHVSQLGPMESLMLSVKQNWPVILVGPPGSGKTSIINQLASFVGADLAIFSMNADIDAMDLVGGYEQVDPSRRKQSFKVMLEKYARRQLLSADKSTTLLLELLELLETNVDVISTKSAELLQGILDIGENSPDFSDILNEFAEFQHMPLQIEGARFQWVDGVLVQALLQGKWLVLDNANLCSSAVLDRLNSLLEPNGYLGINEHSTADGEARIVKPHPNFRIFLTVDPRFGELSRAMRNRAVEICLLPGANRTEGAGDGLRLPVYPLESQMYRFRHFQLDDENLEGTLEVRCQHLSPKDQSLIPSFLSSAALSSSLHSNEASAKQPMSLIRHSLPTHDTSKMSVSRLLKFLSTDWYTAAMHSDQLRSPAFSKGQIPYHPLINELAVFDDADSKSHCLELASVYDVLWDIFNMDIAIGTLSSVKFERRVEKQRLPVFLQAYMKALQTALYLSRDGPDNEDKRALNIPKPARVLFWAFLELASKQGFDRASFQTLLKMLNAELHAFHQQDELLAGLKESIEAAMVPFGSVVQLSTGSEMERVWRTFKPTTPKSAKQLSAVLDLEKLADRLDAAIWRLQLRVDEMVQIQERFADSLHLVRSQDVDAQELVVNLETAVRELEERINVEDAEVTPYFEDEFEGLCQHLDVSQKDVTPDKMSIIRTVRARSSLLARRPTKTMIRHRAAALSDSLQDLYCFLGLEMQSSRELAISDRFHISMLDKICSAEEVQLVQLDRFEAELQIIAQQLSLDVEYITRPQENALSNSFQRLLDGLVASYPDFDDKLTTLDTVLATPAQVSRGDRDCLMLLRSCLSYQTSLENDLESTSEAWIDLALAGLQMYIPNYPFDPALRPMIERKLFNEQKITLQQKMQSLRQFQVVFTGQASSFRIRQMEKEIMDMGAEPPVPPIVRPEVSELDSLQGEFSNLLSIIKPLLVNSMTIQEASRDDTLRQNILRVISRLEEGYRSYDDITGPAVGFLAALIIGLSLSAHSQRMETSLSRSLQYLTQHTPLFGLHDYHDRATAQTLVQSCEQELSQGHSAIDFRWHRLYSLTIIRDVDRPQMNGEQTRNLIHNIFMSFYSEWKRKLLQDQDEEAKKSSLYTYKGDEENADEEDPGLFPDYEQEQEDQPSPSSTSRELAIRLADVHATLFVGKADATDTLKELLEWCCVELVRVAGGEAQGTKHVNTLPAIYLALAKKSDALSSLSAGKGYNFYFDANLAEAKRFIQLIHRIQHRYRQIRHVWPEHATLSDVLRTCDEALAFRHVDPVAKFITKAEKLHGYMYEWQRVASREFSTAPLYDDLTKLLVSWRQLELTTWARLFDLELEKVRDDAKSWFFVAYETIIAASESIEDAQEMKSHARELIKSMENFFASTTLGQFETRMKLLEQFCEHIAMRMQDADALKPVHLALENFIAYFSRLKKPVREAISKGRQKLEKEVNDVIKLASWRDTNIEALKQSAKTSHRKLSKLVRKFRAVLKQPVSGLLRAGFPEESLVMSDVAMEGINTAIVPGANDICEQAVTGWSERPTRFKNIAATVSIMRNKSSPGNDSVDGAIYIESFVTDLETSILQLQKATPTTLTEENKEMVQHLKSRKRKLYADTMKELRQMGIRSNLSSDILAKQDDLSTVLARLPSMKGTLSDRAAGSEYFLHKSLSIMSQVRDVTKEHSGDLTSNDVTKSIGYLESLLHASTRQRGTLSRGTAIIQALQIPIEQVKTLCSHSQDATKVADAEAEGARTLRSSLSWLAMMLKMAGEVTAAQAKLGKTDEFEAVVQGLGEWSLQFRNLAEEFESLPELPMNIWSDAHRALDQKIRDRTSEFRDVFSGWSQYPIPRTVLKHLQPYVFDPAVIAPTMLSESGTTSVEVYSREIFKTLDCILGAMQDVEGALKDVPMSTDDAAWLVKEEQALAAALSGFHAPQITEELEGLLFRLQDSKDDEGLRIVAALFTAVLPIFDQYLASHRYLVARFEALHLATTKLLYRLSKSFIQVGAQGFCTPPEKSNDQQPGKDDKLESGTGLGEGEGAEDISKDIEDDEDLKDLANEEKGEREGSIEEQDDAVDMGEQEMEGEMGDVADKEDQEGDGEDGDEDIESQVGSVDDLGPSAVDEKMWDEGGKEDDSKEKEGQQDLGTENQDEQGAAEETERKDDEKKKDEEESKEGADEDEEMDMEGEDQEENVGVGDTEKMDPHAKEEETLDLPDELNIDGNEDETDNEEKGDMDMGDEEEDEMDTEPGAEPHTKDEEIGAEEEDADQQDSADHVKDDEELGNEEQDDEPVDDDIIPVPDEQADADEPREHKDDQADPNAEAGAGAEANDEAHQNQDQQASASAANQEDGQEGESTEKTQETNAEDGQLGQTAQPDASGRGEDAEETPETQSFKKLGDVLEKWYNQQRQIQHAREKDETQVQQIDKEVDMASAEFEHLQDEEAQADTQALGTATEEQAKALDQDMAMAVDEEEKIPARPEDKEEHVQNDTQDVEMEDSVPQVEQEPQQSTTDGRPQAFVGEQKPFSHDEDQDMVDALPQEDEESDTSSVHSIETQLELTHLDPSHLPTPETARALWFQHEASTHSLSQQLTEHLRLILAPTLATKLRGDFRTGKRLNLKRIIPYIASSYKRDKIWLRRSMPSKRNYQVLIALDDSKSMAESGASNLALKTLTLVARSLAMLEVGEVSVVGFGEDINVAHDFDRPFTSEAGVRVFEQFGFAASKTNVRGLVERSLELFAEARRRGPSSAGEDLWQLMLVVSDGICDDHAGIQRLVRRAQEERVMIVFVIIDSTASPAPLSGQAGQAGHVGPVSTSTPVHPEAAAPASASRDLAAAGNHPATKEKTSILDLQSVEISAEGKVVRWKYMERFPFRYYLVVRDVRELPGVLAGALRQWFGEVAGSA
ncbi:midasin [Lophiostoma macrostomum CBS 122681]|uniref:Midasin n=1 Tax=Lophiostoma macrostomum CBS 122681 TaxID=1314788 RepID=A0A6A6SZR6_9PLEO|nr:midasin [Lophiostoma macrostomum CBS 122681]